MLKGEDKELYDYTMKMMENITSYYLTTDFNKGTNVNKLIEHGVARKIAAVVPDKYTEVEVLVAEVANKLFVSATFSIDGEAEMVAIHKETLTESPVEEMIKAPVSLGVSSRGCGEKPEVDEVYSYDPYSINEDFFFGHPRPAPKTETVEYTSTCGTTEGRGSKVEALPSGKGLDELPDLEYFRKNIMEGIFHKGLKKTMNRPYTKEKIDAARKAEEAEDKPTIDFTQISQLSIPEPTRGELPRHEAGMHVGIDLAKVNIEQELATTMSKEITKEIDSQIIEDMMAAAKAIGVTPPPSWSVPTFGWTEEKTAWENDGIAWRTSLGYMPPSHSPFGGVITTDNTAPTWYDPTRVTMEEISFSEDELDELIDLINTCQSEVMKFA